MSVLCRDYVGIVSEITSVFCRYFVGILSVFCRYFVGDYVGLPRHTVRPPLETSALGGLGVRGRPDGRLQ